MVGTKPTDTDEARDFLMDLIDWMVGCTVGLGESVVMVDIKFVDRL